MAIEVTAIHLEGGAQHEHIASVRWRQDGTGDTGQSSRAEMVGFIETKKGTVYVSDGASRATVGVVVPSHGAKYLRTYADGNWTNNLLSLPKY